VLSLADDGFVTRSEFDTLFQAILPKAQPGSSARAFAALDLEGNGKVDIVSWSHRIRLADMPAMVARIRRHGEGRWPVHCCRTGPTRQHAACV
jgi:hypothetical protein